MKHTEINNQENFITVLIDMLTLETLSIFLYSCFSSISCYISISMDKRKMQNGHIIMIELPASCMITYYSVTDDVHCGAPCENCDVLTLHTNPVPDGVIDCSHHFSCLQVQVNQVRLK